MREPITHRRCGQSNAFLCEAFCVSIRNERLVKLGATRPPQKVATVSAKVATVSAKVATVSAKVATVSAKVATVSAKVATVSANVATVSATRPPQKVASGYYVTPFRSRDFDLLRQGEMGKPAYSDCVACIGSCGGQSPNRRPECPSPQP